uniref:Secreted protein n=1 Tax=Meloidogyne incognita TaxID=6306 RepID=A0A914M326_MELIC
MFSSFRFGAMFVWSYIPFITARSITASRTLTVTFWSPAAPTSRTLVAARTAPRVSTATSRVGTTSRSRTRSRISTSTRAPSITTTPRLTFCNLNDDSKIILT